MNLPQQVDGLIKVLVARLPDEHEASLCILHHIESKQVHHSRQQRLPGKFQRGHEFRMPFRENALHALDLL